MKKRIFAAVKFKPEDELLDVLSDFKESLCGEKIKWVEESNFHITLKFFGDVELDKIEDIVEALNKLSLGYSSFNMKLQGAGFFGKATNPKVIWIGIEDTSHLKSIYEQIEKTTLDLGYPNETREFSPHLTLGRVKYMNNAIRLHELAKKYKNVHFQTSVIDHFILYESILRSSGPIYKPINLFKLNG